MAIIEITISKNDGPPIEQQKFEIDRELALELLDRIKTMVANSPGRHRMTNRTGQDGATVVEIELNHRPPPPVISPTFEELYGPVGGLSQKSDNYQNERNRNYAQSTRT